MCIRDRISDSLISNQLVDYFVPIKTVYPTAKDVCCTDFPDAFLQFLQPAYPCGDSIGVSISICNTGEVVLPDSFPISLYELNPLLENQTSLTTFFTPNSIPADRCRLITQTILRPTSDSLFILLGDNNFQSPIELPCDFPIIPVTECSYYNNLGAIAIPEQIRIQGFEDDLFIQCPIDVLGTSIVAPPFLSNPVWNNEFYTETLMVHEPGWYYLSGTTPCGEIFTDSIELVSDVPNYQFETSDTTICVGEPFIVNLGPSHLPRVLSLDANDDMVIRGCRSTGACESDTLIFLTEGSFVLESNIFLGNFCNPSDEILSLIHISEPTRPL